MITPALERNHTRRHMHTQLVHAPVAVPPPKRSRPPEEVSKRPPVTSRARSSRTRRAVPPPKRSRPLALASATADRSQPYRQNPLRTGAATKPARETPAPNWETEPFGDKYHRSSQKLGSTHHFATKKLKSIGFLRFVAECHGNLTIRLCKQEV